LAEVFLQGEFIRDAVGFAVVESDEIEGSHFAPAMMPPDSVPGALAKKESS